MVAALNSYAQTIVIQHIKPKLIKRYGQKHQLR